MPTNKINPTNTRFTICIISTPSGKYGSITRRPNLRRSLRIEHSKLRHPLSVPRRAVYLTLFEFRLGSYGTQSSTHQPTGRSYSLQAGRLSREHLSVGEWQNKQKLPKRIHRDVTPLPCQ